MAAAESPRAAVVVVAGIREVAEVAGAERMSEAEAVAVDVLWAAAVAHRTLSPVPRCTVRRRGAESHILRVVAGNPRRLIARRHSRIPITLPDLAVRRRL